MANEEQLEILKQGPEPWNRWRKKNPEVKIDLSHCVIVGGRFNHVNLSNANVSNSYFNGADFRFANLVAVDFTETFLDATDFRKANLSSANLSRANLFGSDFTGAILSGANFRKADLTATRLINTAIDKAVFSESSVYAIRIWDLKGEFEEQKDLVITPEGAPVITVDNIKVAQFVYLILNNKEIRDVINTLTSKSVLILGRFAEPERKAILNALRNKLREYNLLPIVFDFDRPIDRNITETVKTLAAISYFVIADVTSPKSSPLELQAIIPDFQIPVVPIIQEGELPFSMINDLKNQHYGLLDPLTYDSEEMLIKVLKSAIIDPAIEKHNELRLIKARAPKIRSAKDFLDKVEE